MKPGDAARVKVTLGAAKPAFAADLPSDEQSDGFTYEQIGYAAKVARGNCGVRSGQSGYVCSRVSHHLGPHIALVGTVLCSIWGGVRSVPDHIPTFTSTSEADAWLDAHTKDTL